MINKEDFRKKLIDVIDRIKRSAHIQLSTKDNSFSLFDYCGRIIYIKKKDKHFNFSSKSISFYNPLDEEEFDEIFRLVDNKLNSLLHAEMKDEYESFMVR